MINKQSKSYDYLLKRGFGKAKIGIISNHILKNTIDDISIYQTEPYESIPDFPRDKSLKAKGELIYGNWFGEDIYFMDRALHYYRGFSAEEIIYPVRLMMLAGVKLIIMVNFAGSVSPNIAKGEFMVNTDHINLIPDNPFIGQNSDNPGSRFLDMVPPYNLDLAYKVINYGKKLSIKIHEGTYLAISGPSFPSPAEYKFYSHIGADVIGMTGIFEAIAAKQMGVDFINLNLIVENCDPEKPDPKSLDNIIEIITQSEDKIHSLLKSIITMS
ncbi:MAG: purine-nucleoside phosphorylase [Hyphomicrobiales bacterium]